MPTSPCGSPIAATCWSTAASPWKETAPNSWRGRGRRARTPTLALRLAHRGYVLVNGRIAMEGTGAELLARPEVRDAYLGGGAPLPPPPPAGGPHAAAGPPG